MCVIYLRLFLISSLGDISTSYILRPSLSFSYPASVAKLPQWEKALWANTTVSSIHATLITYLVTKAILTTEVYTTDDFTFSTEETDTINIIFLSYILYDTFFCFLYIKKWPGIAATLIHHFVAALCYSHLLYGGYGHNLAMVAISAEATTPFINMRYFLDTSGARQKWTTLYLVNGLLITFGWLIVRIIAPTIGIYTFLYGQFDQLLQQGPVATAILPFTVCCGYLLQVFWFHKIVKGALKVLSGDSKKNDQNKRNKKE